MRCRSCQLHIDKLSNPHCTRQICTGVTLLQAQDGFVSFQRFYKDQLKAQQQRKANKYSNRGRQHHHSQPSSKHKAADKGRDKVQENGGGGPKERQGSGSEAATRKKVSGL